jgi:methyltransferase-like protein
MDDFSLADNNDDSTSQISIQNLDIPIQQSSDQEQKITVNQSLQTTPKEEEQSNQQNIHTMILESLDEPNILTKKVYDITEEGASLGRHQSNTISIQE